MPTDDQKHRSGRSPVRAGRHTSHRTGVPTRQHSGVLSSARSQSKGHPTHTSFLTSFLSLLLKIIENKKLSSTKRFGNSQCESSTMLAVQTGMELQATREMCPDTPCPPRAAGPVPALPLEGQVPTQASPVRAIPAALGVVKDAIIVAEGTQLASKVLVDLMEAQEGRGGGAHGLAWWVSTGRRSVFRSHTSTDR